MTLIKQLLLYLLFSACSSTHTPPTTPTPEEKHPAPETSPASPVTTLCAIGDGGTGEARQYEVAKVFNAEHCDIRLYAGDIIYPLGLKNENDTQFFAKFWRPYLPGLKTSRFALALGNHDYYLGKSEAWIKIAQAYSQIIFPSRYYMHQINDVCLFVFDSNRDYAKQRDWVIPLYQNSKNCIGKVALTHHPYKSSGSHGHAGGSYKNFLQKYVLGHVNMLISGHDHQLSDEGVWQGTTQLISGAGAKLRGHGCSKVWGGKDYGYVVIRHQGGAFNYEFVGARKGERISLHKGIIEAL